MFRLPPRLSLSLSLSLICAGIASQAHATYAFESVPVERIYTYDAWVDPGQCIRFQTTNLSFGSDTVLHLWSTIGKRELAYNDDVPGTWASQVDYCATTSAELVQLVLRAYAPAKAGTASVMMARYAAGNAASAPAGTTIANQVAFADARIAVPSGANVIVETVLSPASVTDTMMLGFDAGNRLVAYDDDGGVDYASRISDSRVQSVLIRPYGNLDAGVTRLIVNDLSIDTDGDKLGASLEAELRTCDNDPRWCVGVFNPSDTDRDGLSDGVEVYGFEHPTGNQLLPRWGADPRHKDIFVEVDFTDDFGMERPLDEAGIAQIQRYFDQGPASHLQNPDGISGVRVHLDVGFSASTNTDTRYGNWGGSNAVPTATADYQTHADTQRVKARAGVFRYALAAKTGTGQAQGDRFGWNAVATAHGNPATFTHELGHSVGLAHHGHDAWGTLNCKPIYRSLMNYASSTGFSLGTSSVVLNPSSVTETTGLGAGVDNGYLGQAPYYFAVNGAQVDWNRDGQFTSAAARAGITWATYESCGALDQAAQILALGDAENAYLPAVPDATPALVRVGERLYAFWVGSDYRLHYRHGRIASTTANGSCPGGQGIYDTCMTWSDPNIVPTSDAVVGFSAVSFRDSRIVIARRSEFDLLFVQSGSVDGAGNLVDWREEQVIPESLDDLPEGSTSDAAWAYSDAEPELEVMTVNPALFDGQTEVVALFYRRPGGTYAWATAFDPAEAWTAQGAVYELNGASLAGALSPTVSTRGFGAGAEHCGVFSDGSALRLHCYDRATNRWVDQTSRAFAPFPHLRGATAKAGLAFHVLRSAAGVALDGERYGQWHMTANRGPFSDVFVSNAIGSQVASNGSVGFTQVGKLSNQWSRSLRGTGIALYEDARLGSLKAMRVWDVYLAYDAYGRSLGFADPRYPAPAAIHFLPFADGTVSVDLRDGSDFMVMERGICTTLRGTAWCGDANTTVSKL